jgi:aspartate/methionine/tyrosine aminotransferase
MTDSVASGSVGDYLITQWLFAIAGGRFEIDLGESCAQVQTLADLKVEGDLRLDYSLDRGDVATREAVARLYAGGRSADDVLITHGGQEALYLFYRTFLKPGDHVITTVPGWQQSWEIPRAAGCSVSLLSWRPGHPFEPAALEEMLRPETSVVVLCSPGNPSGCALTEQEWTAILDLLDRAGVWLISDEEFLTDLSQSVIGKYSRCMSVSSLSKKYGLPGLRLGWGATASAEGRAIFEKMVNYKRYVSMTNSPLCEQVGRVVLADVERQNERYLTLLQTGLPELAKFAAAHEDVISLVQPQGTPYCWFNLDPSISSQDLAMRLLEEYSTLIMPAEVFGSANGFRLTYARPIEVLDAGFERFGELLKRI